MKNRINITLSRQDIAIVDLLSEKACMSRSEYIASLIHISYGMQLDDQDAITSSDVYKRIDEMI